jgi:hypothetical protein
MPKTDEIDLSTAEAVCGTCGTPIFVVEGDEDWDGEGPNPGLVWAHAEEVRCDDPDARFLLDDEPAEPEPAVSVVEPAAPRRRRPPAALLFAALLGIGGLGALDGDGFDYATFPGAPTPRRRRGPGGGPARELPEADKARQAAAEAKRARRAAKARENAERSARGRGGRGGEGA